MRAKPLSPRASGPQAALGPFQAFPVLAPGGIGAQPELLLLVPPPGGAAAAAVRGRRRRHFVAARRREGGVGS